MKLLATIFTAVALLPFASSINAQESTPFGDVLNKCLSVRGGAVVDCTRLAGEISGSDRVRIIQDFTIGAQEQDTRGLESANCKTRPDGSEYCEVFSCGADEANLMSACELVGHCVFEASSGSKASCDF